jgi:hypothetical protein
MNMAGYSQWICLSLVFDFHAAIPFDFFSARYFFKARRLFCLLRRCKFTDGSSVRRTLASRGRLEWCVAVRAMTSDLTNSDTFFSPPLAPVHPRKSRTTSPTLKKADIDAALEHAARHIQAGSDPRKVSMRRFKMA